MFQGPDQGDPPMCRGPGVARLEGMARYLLHHRHSPEDCGVVFASFRGLESPLRHRATLASCRSGGHAIWWTVDAANEAEAMRLLPSYVAERTTASPVSEVRIP
jgi:hypothetical protein